MCPVPNMVSLSKRQAAAWEATALVAMLKRAPQRGGNRAGSGADFCNPSIGIVPHHHAAGVACEALRRSRGNADTALEHRLPWRIDVGQHRGIDVNDDLVPLTRRAGLHSTVQGGLSNEREGIRRLLFHGRRPRRAVDEGRSRGNVFARRYSASRAAASACITTAPTSGSSRPRITTMPSASGYTCTARCRCPPVLSSTSALRSIRRQPRTIISTCSAVPARPTASSRSSVSGVATRVSARIFEYDSSPQASASFNRGSDPSAFATRTRSHAAPGSRLE